MNRTPRAEAQRKLSLAQTLYARMLAKQILSRAAYQAKIDRLKNELASFDASI
ncbi:hypothetical protein GCM10009688_18790 [Arthrobacter gandavensis]|uniref:Uncharacterized protein n=1 Tax=Arthrobacter gandavensis TaxID=169960 RepID=A0ABP5AJ87_9MICC|nr:hypothetical protein [Arthrobacter citreus]